MPKNSGKNKEINSGNGSANNKEPSQMLHQLAQEEIVDYMGAFISGLADEIINPSNVIRLNGKLLSKAWKDISLILHHHYEENGDFDLAGLNYTRAHPRITQLISEIVDGAVHLQNIGLSTSDFARRDIP